MDLREIEYIVVHCTATPKTATVESILNWWRTKLGWRNPGYHYIIDQHGIITALHPESKVSNGVRGYNQQSVHVSYIGGVMPDTSQRPIDSRTPAQKQGLFLLLKQLKDKYPKAVIQGHRDFPGVTKACPSFDAKTEYQNL